MEPAERSSALLTRREREVVALVAQGLTNRQIGAELHISEYTAGTHVKHALRKLSFRSRTQLALWEAGNGDFGG